MGQVINFESARKKYKGNIYNVSRKSKNGKVIDFNEAKDKLIKAGKVGGLAVGAAAVGVAGVEADIIPVPDYVEDVCGDVCDDILKLTSFLGEKLNDAQKRVLKNLFPVGDGMILDTENNELIDGNEVDKRLREVGNKEATMTCSGNSKFGNYQIVDLSNHNGSVDIEKMKNDGVDAVIIRMYDSWFMDYSENNLAKLDSEFADTIEKCEKAGMPYGIYIYSRATNEEMAKMEAKKVLKFASQYNARPTLPIYWDIESQQGQPLYDMNNNQINSVDFINKHPDQVIKNFKAFADVLEENNYYVGIYTGDNVLCHIDPNGDKLKDYAIWAARYKYSETQCDFKHFDYVNPQYKGDIGIYQFSSTGKVNGVPSSHVDCNMGKYDYCKAIKNNKLNYPVKDEKIYAKCLNLVA